MSKNLKSLNSGVLKCGASQFKANIPSIQGVSLSPATEDAVNMVLEATKPQADTLIAEITNAGVSHATENYFEGETEMVRIYLAAPVVDNYLTEASIKLGAAKRVFCYIAGQYPNSYFGETFSPAVTEEIYFINEVELPANFLHTSAFSTDCNITFCKHASLEGDSMRLTSESDTKITLKFNSQVIMSDRNAIRGMDYDVILNPQNDDEGISYKAFFGNVENLTYLGEWNTTTRAWFSGSIYYLNGEPLDPQV